MKSPAFQFYPTDYLGSQRVQMMTLEEEGAYCRLLWSCWQHGSIPADPDIAARLVGKGCSTTVARVVLPMFEVACGEGRLTHDRLERERLKQAEWKAKSSAGGKKSAEMRQTPKGGSRVVQPHYQPKVNIPTPSLSPTPSPISDPVSVSTSVSVPPEEPTAPVALELFGKEVKAEGKPRSREQAEEYAQELGMTEDGFNSWYDHFESNGWKVSGKAAMKDWRAAMRNGKRRAKEFGTGPKKNEMLYQ